MSSEGDWEATMEEFWAWFFSPSTTDEERTLYTMELDLLQSNRRPASPFDRPSSQE